VHYADIRVDNSHCKPSLTDTLPYSNSGSSSYRFNQLCGE